MTRNNTADIFYDLTEEFAEELKELMKTVEELSKSLRNFEKETGEKLLIPINMRDGCIIGVGKGNEDWNCSAPHGAGRIMSRSEAKELVSLDEFEKSMQGIFTTSVNQSTIDESPMVYKSMSEIVKNITDTIEILKIIKPIYNYKSCE